MNGYNGKLLFVDLSTGKIEVRPLEEKVARDFLGGYGIGAKVLYDEMPAHVDAFAPESMVGFLASPLNGTNALFSGRYTVVSKSPITGGWNDANSGGLFAPMLKKAGFDGVFVKGISEKPVYIMIDNGEVSIRDASDLWGLTTMQTEKALAEKLEGKKFDAAMVAPGGENMAYAAAVMNDSHRAAARGGTAAVMGSKKLKALVVSGNQTIPVADKAAVLEANKAILEWHKSGPTAHMVAAWRDWGTSNAYTVNVMIGDASVKNWTGAGVVEMTEEQLEPVTAQAMERFKKKKYACASCPVGCGAIYDVVEGDVKLENTSRPEYETTGMFCSQLLNTDPIVLNQCNYLCNEYGMDTITVGGTVGWAMECYDKGILSKEDIDGIELTWGNGPAIVALTEKICKCEGVGKILANGSCFAADHFGRGHECLVVAGRIEIPQHDSRFGTALARTYKFDPTPGRHVKGGMGSGFGNAPAEVKFNTDGLAEPDVAGTAFSENVYAAGLCCFADLMIPPPAVAGLVNAVTGFGYTEEEFVKLGKRIFAMRHAFNLREGFRRKDTSISDRIIGKPPLKEGPLADVTVDVERFGDNFYRLMGYNIEDGVPTKETLEQLGGLECVIRDLYPEAK